MKQVQITFLLVVLMNMVGTNSFAHDIAVANADGVTIYYLWKNNKTELAVSYRGSSYSSYSNEYSGNVVIPESVEYGGTTYSVTNIDNYAFEGCSDLTSVSIPNSVSYIGTSVFSGCTCLNKISVNSSNTTYCSLDGVLMNKNQTSIIAFPEAKESYVLPASISSLNPSILGSNLKSFQIADSDTPLTLTSGKFPKIENIYIGRNITLSSNYYYPFSGVEIESVVLGNNMTNIAERLFSSSYIKSVTIPSSVTTINSGAFNYCSHLESVNYLGTISQWLGMTFLNNPLHNGAALYLYESPINDLTFANIDGTVGTQLQGCTNLKSVTIANSNTIIAENAFRNCSSLEKITIPKSITAINNNAFSGCEKLHTVYYNGTIADWYAMTLIHNPLSFGADLYLNNTLLTTVTIPSSITTIGTHLKGCTSLKTLNIPSGVTCIGSNAFDGCSSLASVSIPYGVTSIASRAFGSCISLTSVTIPGSVTDLNMSAFAGCTALQNINFSGSENYTTIDGVVYDKDVTRIITYPQAKTSTTYTYPSTITDFSGIKNNPYLKRIYVPTLSNTPSINSYVFNAGDNLEAVEFTDFVGDYYTKDGVIYKKYEYNGEQQNYLVFCPRGKTSLTVTSDVRYIQVDGFFSNSKLESLIIEPSERSLNLYSNSSYPSSYAFHSPLKNVSLGRQISYSELYNYRVFANNPSLETVVIGENMTSIPSSLFVGCIGLSNVTLPETVTSVGSNAFTSTPWLESLPMFDGVRYYKNIALQYEYSEETKDVRVKDGISVLAGGLFENSNVKSVTFPISVTSLESRLFYSCEYLKKVVLPNSIKSIPQNLYLGYTNKQSYGFTSIDGAVENIHVPGSVSWIGIYSINQCDTVVIEDGNSELTLQDRNADDGYWDGALSHVKKLYVGRNMGLNGSSYSGQVFCALNSSSTNLLDVIFGPLVTRAFTGTSFRCCDHVNSVTCLSKEPFPSPDFYQIPQTAVLNVPLGSKQNYESAQGWSDFNSIKEVTEVTITLDDTEMVYAGDFDLDFSRVVGLQAFTAGDYDLGTSSITFNPVQIVSAGKGVILKGTKGTYTVPCTNIEPTLADPLCGTISGRFIRSAQDDNVNYVFDKVEHVFKPVDPVYGYQLSRNEAYLSLPVSSISGDGGIITPRYMMPECNTLSTLDVSIAKGKTAQMSVYMDNLNDITAFQFYVKVPKGITLTDAVLSERKSSSHSVQYIKQDDGIYKVMGVSTMTELFSGNDGKLVNLKLSASNEIKLGNYNVIVKNILLTAPTQQKFYPSDISAVLSVLEYLEGDADGDGVIDVADIVAMVNSIMGQPSSDFVKEAADLNGDGEVDIFDVMLAINLVLNQKGSNGSKTRGADIDNALQKMDMMSANDGIKLNIANAERYSAFQFDVEVPEGSELMEARLIGSENTHFIKFDQIGENRYKVMAVSLDNNPLRGTADGLLTLSLSNNSGSLALIDNILFVTPEGEKAYFAVSHGNSATTIKEVGIEQEDVIYDLSGRRVTCTRESMPKGIYIINNKKVVIK